MLLLAFTLQSFVTQTHVHFSLHAIDRAAAVKVLVNASDHGKSPIGNDTTDCPFCQAIFSAGAFFIPAPLPLLPPTMWAENVGRSMSASAPDSEIAHSWQSRAPPRV